MNLSNHITRKRLKYAAIVAVILLLSWNVVSYLWLGPNAFFLQRESGKDIQKAAYDSDNAVDNYEWFKQQHYDIISKRQQMNNTRQQIKQFHETYGDDPNQWSRTAETRHNRLHQQLLGQQNMHNDMVAKYNARSEMANRAMFKDSLPYEMEKKFWTGDLR